MAHVQLHDVTKRFGDVKAVDGVNLVIESGSFTTLLGPSGCGKTTLLRMIAGFLDPNEGRIEIDGRDQVGVPPNKRPTSIVFQDYALFPHLTVFDNVAYGPRAHGTPKRQVRERVEKALELIGMSSFGRRYPRELSGGQQQRVALGRSIVLEPSVLLMDEPLSNLDAKLRISIRKEITNLQRVTGVTTIYVTHDQEEALAMSDKIAVMNAGRVDQYGSPEDVFYRPSSHFVADFIGLANFIPAQVTRIDGASCELAFGSKRRIETRVADSSALSVGAAVTAMLRPEGIEVLPADVEGHARAIVRDSAMLGSGVRYWVELDGHTLTVNQVKEPGDAIHEGDVTLRFKTNWVHVMPAEEG